MGIYSDPSMFGLPTSLMRNDTAVAILRQTADNLEKRIEAVKTIGTMENFWKAPIDRIGPDGKITREPFDPSLGIPYQSVAPIRLNIVDTPYRGPDTIGPRLKKAFIIYCDVAKRNGTELPKFDSRLGKFKFLLRHQLTKWGII